MATTRGLERLIFFSDAVVAIAITLLVLPVVDAAANAGEAQGSPAEFLADHTAQLFGFALSFVVIASLWRAHHALFEHVKSYSPLVMVLSLMWAFTIVLLPLPTAMTAQWSSGPLVVGFYTGTMAVSSVIIALLALTVRRNPALNLDENPITTRTVEGCLAAAGLYLLAFVLGVFIPALNYYALFVMVLLWPIGTWLRRRHSVPDPSQAAPASQPQ